MTECSRRDDLVAYIDGELDPETGAEVAAHLAVCPACVREVKALGVMASVLDCLPDEEPPPDLIAGIEAALEQDWSGQQVVAGGFALSLAVAFTVVVVVALPLIILWGLPEGAGLAWSWWKAKTAGVVVTLCEQGLAALDVVPGYLQTWVDRLGLGLQLSARGVTSAWEIYRVSWPLVLTAAGGVLVLNLVALSYFNRYLLWKGLER